jgi:hypothetical protein
MLKFARKLWAPAFMLGLFVLTNENEASASDSQPVVCMGVIYQTGCCWCETDMCIHTTDAGSFTCGNNPGQCPPSNKCPDTN